jgi:glycosyltransferase involved in cell wall biosynthesis
VRTVTSRIIPRAGLRAIGRALHQPGGARIAPRLYASALCSSFDSQTPPQPAVIYWVGTGIELMGFAALRVARRRGVPFVVLPALHPGQWGDASVDARLYASADAVIALSEHERGVLIDLGVSPQRVHVIRLGSTVRHVGDGRRFRERYGIREQPLVAFLGRRTTEKGLPVLLTALQALRAEAPACCLAVAGPPGDVLVPPAPGVVDIGMCDEQAKADLLAAADVLCVPSSAESFGFVYVDSWSMGTPVICGPAAAARELVRHGVDGLHADQSAASVASAIGSVLADPERARIMGAAGRERQSRELTWEAAAAAHAKLLVEMRAASLRTEAMTPSS